MTFQERYKYNPSTDLLGKGGFARVYKATDTLLDREVAIKIFNVTDQSQYTVVEEIKKAIKLEHPNLLRYYDVAILEHNNAMGEKETMQIGVMELANAGDLKQFARNNPNSPVLFQLLQQVLSGLEYLHQRGIIHRDLKPQNILLVERDGVLTAKISDFGISKNLEKSSNSSSMAIGTIEYMAPEQFNPAKYGINGKIGTNVDLWSFGIMVHELLTNESLFGQRDGSTTAEQIMSAILSNEIPTDLDRLPEPYRTATKQCLVKDARERIQKAQEVINIISQNDSQETKFYNKAPEAIKFKNNDEHLDYDETVKLKTPSNKETKGGKTEKPKSYRNILVIVSILFWIQAFFFIWEGEIRLENSIGDSGILFFILIELICVFAISLLLFIIRLFAYKKMVFKNIWGAVTKILLINCSCFFITFYLISSHYNEKYEENMKKFKENFLPFSDSFNNNNNDWPLFNDNNNSEKVISNGKFIIKGITDSFDYTSSKWFRVDTSKDFSCSVEVKLIKGNTDNGFGINFCRDYFFKISSDGKYTVYIAKNNHLVKIKEWTYCSHILKGYKLNLLTIKKNSQTTVFFINNFEVAQLTCNEGSGTDFGFIVSGKRTVEFDNFELTGTNPSNDTKREQ